MTQCTCKNMKAFYACKYGCKPGDSVQYCRKTEDGKVNKPLPSPLIVPKK